MSFSARLLFLCVLAIAVLSHDPRAIAEPPAVGTVAPDFTLHTPQGTTVQLSRWSKDNRTVLVILRGYPGYQCPYCQKQVHDFVNRAADFAAEGVSVLLVYPGPPAELGERAKEFLAKQSQLPPNMTLVTDPDFKVTEMYGLRWNEPGETAYPSAFLLGKDRRILFAKISRSHDDRLSAQDALDHLKKR
jgi:peroxiredoxin Q/BCP